MVDHMAKGRFVFGISPGGLLSDAEAFGNLDKDRTAMFVEAIDHILAIWQGAPPYDLEGRFWNISTARTLMPELGQGTIAKPYQRPHPPIVVTAVAPFSKGVIAAAERGWDPDLGEFSPAAMGQDALAELCRGLRERRPRCRSSALAGGQEHLCR